jgi:WD40 repeat protein
MINSWNLKTGELYVSLKGHINEITKLALRNKNTLLSSSLDCELR